MAEYRKPWSVWITGAVLVLAVTLPYVYAAAAAGESHVFGGILFNPLDGNSYLAKMYQGFQGSWQFRLPYTPDPGQGAYLFMFYLLLGHVARLLGSSLVGIYHAARVASALFMLLAIYRFCASILPDARLVRLAFVLTSLGSGLGWLALPFGAFTADFWVAEAFPFLSAYANPHFPLALGLLLWILTPPRPRDPASATKSVLASFLEAWTTAPLALLLALVSPFAVVLALLVLGGTAMIGWLLPQEENTTRWLYASRLVWTAFSGLPVLLYDQWVTSNSPQLSAWNAQNVTPAPALWDLLLSFSPLLILAVLGAWRLFTLKPGIRRAGLQQWLVPLVWVALGICLLYAPLNLQRRFVVGLYVPLGVLAVWAVDWLSAAQPGRLRLVSLLLILVVLPSNLIVILAARHGAQQLDPLLYLSREEADAFAWLRQNSMPQAVVLASPRTGLWIPAHTGRRVVYGHPYETVQAESQKQAVEAFFSGDWTKEQMLEFLSEQGVDYIFYGPQERLFGDEMSIATWEAAFQSGSVSVYALQPALAAKRTGVVP